MIHAIYETYHDIESSELSLQDISTMKISEVTTDQTSSPSIQILQKAKLVEIHMGLRNLMGEYEGLVLEKQWMEVLISVLEFSDRNTQLLLIDQLITLLLSECMFCFTISFS